MRLLEFWQKYYQFRDAFLLRYERANGLSTFWESKMFGKNIVIELRSKILKTN